MNPPWRRLTQMNKRLKRARLDLGLSVMQVSQRASIAYGLLLAYERGLSPLGTRGTWRVSARTLADFYGYGLDYLWPGCAPTAGEIATAIETAPDLEDVYLRAERRMAVREALARINPRKRELLTRRFSDDPETRPSIGIALGVSRTRVEQLERVALYDLRNALLLKIHGRSERWYMHADMFI